MALSYTLQQLGDHILNELEAWGVEDILAGAITASTASFTCTDLTLYNKYTPLEIGEEVLIPSAKPTTTTVAVTGGRGRRGSTAASHSLNDIIRIAPKIFRREIDILINECVTAHLQQTKEDTSLTTTLNVEKYDLPTAIKCRDIKHIGIMDNDNANVAGWVSNIIFHYGTGASSVDQIEFRNTPIATRKIKLVYRAGFTRMTTLSATTDLPADSEQAQRLPVLYACSRLVPHKESKRLMQDKNTFPEGSTPPTARVKDGAYYENLFKEERAKAGLAPSRSGTLFYQR